MTHVTLADRLWTQGSTSALLRNGALMIIGSLIVAIAAQVNVPMQPVPMTLQTLAVLAVGAAFGSRLGAATLLLYLWEGAIGLPVFAEMKAGLPVLLGPTGGYLFGFVLAAGLVGWLAERGFDRNVLRMLAAMLIGAAIIYVPGVIWLSTFLGGFEKAFTFGLAPFWLGDVVKAFIAALAFPLVWKWLGQR
ncbi:MAG: biotin transporter BioY [Proteobacteria bacterium]|nr:biotin transporter BioY [Pseudomonadota bacterium]